MNVKFHKSRYGSIGCTVGLAPHVYVGAYGADAPEALAKAGALAAELQNLVDGHPELQAAVALVPGGAVALKAISAASALYGSGASLKDVQAAIGPKVASVVKSILKLF